MQNTRLTVLTNSTLNRLERWFNNPWRRTSLYIICPLLGFLLASLVSTISGATSIWDPYAAGGLLLITELVNRIVYRGNRQPESSNSSQRSLFWESLNLLKIGLIYGMFLEALKLGS